MNFIPTHLDIELKEQLQCADILITSKTVWKLVLDYFEDSTIGPSRVVIVPPNPSVEFLEDLMPRLGKTGSFIVAIGGGSVIDVAKMLRSFQARFDRRTAYDGGCILQTLLDPCLSAGQCARARISFWPTTSGTGAEITNFATLWDAGAQKKYSVKCLNNRNDAIYYWPYFYKSADIEVRVASTFDSLAHCYDTIWNRFSSASDKNAAIEIASTILEEIVAGRYNSDEDESVYNLFLCGAAAGALIKRNKTSLCHAMSYYLTIQFGLPHGFAVGASLSSVSKWCVDSGHDGSNGWLAERHSDLLIVEERLKLFQACRQFLPQTISEIEFSYYTQAVFSEERYKNFLTTLTQQELEFLLRDFLSKIYV